MLQQLGGSVFGGVPVQRPLVDVLIVRCGEDLRWVMEWLKRILRDEWTPEVPGLQVRLVIYEKCLVSEAAWRMDEGAVEKGTALRKQEGGSEKNPRGKDDQAFLRIRSF
jgi:hypothetical protein